MQLLIDSPSSLSIFLKNIIDRVGEETTRSVGWWLMAGAHLF
jgi:hypothetical protein